MPSVMPYALPLGLSDEVELWLVAAVNSPAYMDWPWLYAIAQHADPDGLTVVANRDLWRAGGGRWHFSSLGVVCQRLARHGVLERIAEDRWKLVTTRRVEKTGWRSDWLAGSLAPGEQTALDRVTL